ncbi:hypothetical protein [Streptomyces sp. NPDC006463]|uniref:hypothetical protein n=1 Tax=Streptomyces sp. NPDC006463 TaxID=3364746 RepID=UPI00369302A0
MRDTGPAAAATLDYGLSQRALIAISSRSGDVAELNPPTRRARPQRPPGLDEPAVRAVVRQAVRDVRSAPPPRPAEPPADPIVAEMRSVVDGLVTSTYAIGELMLDVAPAYLSDEQAANVLALLCDQIGEPPSTAWPPGATRCPATAARCTATSCNRRRCQAGMRRSRTASRLNGTRLSPVRMWPGAAGAGTAEAVRSRQDDRLSAG